jgi:hypothetical protein
MATLYKTDGTTEEHTPDGKKITLAQAQGLVGGYVELVRLGKKGVLLVDEEGLIKQLPINHQASKLAGKLLVGPVLHTRAEGWG